MNQAATRNFPTLAVPVLCRWACRPIASAALGLSLSLCLSLLSGDSARAEDAIEYNRDIRPILSENCFRCHGPDSASRKADLRLDKREVAVDLGAIVPGDAESSELVARILSDDPTVIMPPPKSHKTLTPAQKELLSKWVAAGAEYQPHWSFITPVRPALPAVKDAGWVRNPIDRFVLAKLEEHGLHPAPEADRRTLARRLSLDLTGLPPAPADVETFVNDTAPDAYEKYVDRLLASPQWGEHRGRYWLDAARYADTHGIHFDNYREMWTYRDWVINAFNRNLAFDRFTIEQLAGDMLPDHTLDQQIASGFNRCNITTNEGGVIPEEYLVLYARDRTETVSQVWLGLTAGCAVCHDHKFDPLSQKEFYEMAAFFNNTTQNALDGNIKDTPPKVFVPLDSDRPRWEQLSQDEASLNEQLSARKQAARPEFDKWLADAKPEALRGTIPGEGLRLHAPLDPREANAAPPAARSQEGPRLEASDSGDFERDQPFSYGAWVKVGKAGQAASVLARMDDQHDYRGWDLWIENERIAAHLVNKWPSDALKVATDTPVKPNEWAHVFVTYDGSSRPEGLKIYLNGQAQATSVQTNSLKSTVRTTVPLKVGQRHSTAKLEGSSIHDVRVYNRTLSAEEVARLVSGGLGSWLVAQKADERPAADVNALFDLWIRNQDDPSRELRGRLDAVEKELAAIKERGTVAHVMNEKVEEPMAYILYRGEYDKRRDPVKATTPSALPAMPPDLPRNRLGFAQWLVRPEHPLTARVTVNRFWQELFGTGLVRTTGDFGISGELPSHPELLDWMAVEFRESGWDIKAFYKLLVTSATYRQAAVATPEKLEKDNQNRLLSRGPRFRMDAEMVRDYALAASGQLSTKLGGPSVKPYQPEGVWEAVAMPESNTRNYKRDEGESLYRRSLYTFWKRAAPPASMDIFNAPNRETCTVRRERTNTPLQALVTLNSTQFVEAARTLAEHAFKEGGDSNDARLNYISARLLARPFRDEERSVLNGSIENLTAYYQAHPEDAAKLLAVGETKADASLDAPTLAAWTMLTNELMNLDEVLNK